MLATDRFLLISVGRTGTGALHLWLQKNRTLQIISNVAHEPYQVMAEKCMDAIGYVPPAWTIIRNPWDYYVDKWCWERDKGPCFDGPFKEFMRITKDQPTVEGYFYSLTQKWDDLGADRAEHIARFENYDEDVVRILRTLTRMPESYIRGMMAACRGYGESVTPSGMPQWYEGHKGIYQAYYDDESRQWVAQMDEGIIERFGYDFLEGPF